MVWPSTALNAVEGSRPFVNKLREYLQFYRKRFLFFVAEQTALTATTASAFAKAFCERRGKSFSLAWNEKWKKERWNSSLSPWPLERYTGRKEKGKLILAGAYFSSHTHIYIYIYIYIYILLIMWWKRKETTEGLYILWTQVVKFLPCKLYLK